MLSDTRVKIALPMLAILMFVIAVNEWALRFPSRWDLTAAGLYSISEPTIKVLDQITQPVRITYFYDVRHRTMQDGKALLEQYSRHAPQVTVRTVDPSMEPSVARHYGVLFPGTIVMETATQKISIQGGSETDFTNGLIRVTQQKIQTICFTEGHGEIDPFSMVATDHAENAAGPGTGGRHDGFGRALQIHEKKGGAMAREALQTLGYDVRKLSLVTNNQAIAGCGVVLLAGPQTHFLPEEIAQLAAYLARGGKMLALLEAKPHGLGPLLEKFGIIHEPVEILDPERHYGTDEGSPAVNDYPRHALTRDLVMTFFPGASSLKPTAQLPAGVRLTPLIQTTANARAMAATGLETGIKKVALQAPQRYTLGVLASQTRATDAQTPGGKAELVVITDADFATNAYFGTLGNGALLLNAVNYLAQQENLITIRPRNYELPQVKLSNEQMRITFFISTILAPLLAAVAGLVVCWRRRG